MSDDSAELLCQHGVRVTAHCPAVLQAVSGQPHGVANNLAGVVRAEIDKAGVVYWNRCPEYFAETRVPVGN